MSDEMQEPDIYDSLSNRFFEAGFLAGQKEGYGIGYRAGYEAGREAEYHARVGRGPERAEAALKEFIEKGAGK